MDDRIDGRYRILAELGSGGSGTVYKVEDERSGATIALKVLAHAGERQREKLLRFRREFRAAAALDHPNVVRVFDFVAGHLSYFTMEWIDGVDIAEYFGAGARGAAGAHSARRHERLVAALRQLFDALDYIHERQIVHRDLKPENVLILDAPASEMTAPLVKITDFGLARDLRDATTLTQPGVVLGTLAYVSPEQAGMRTIDGRADLYAAGVLLYRLLTGTLPFRTDTVSNMLWKHCSEDPEPPHRRRPEVNRHLERICLRLLRKDPFERFQRASDVVRALQRTTATPPLLPDVVARRKAVASEAVRLFAPRHVGRAAEVARLGALIAEPTPGAALLSGPAGSGKSRLLSEVVAAGADLEVVPVRVRFAPTQDDPLADLTAGLAELHHRLGGLPPAHVRQRMDAATRARLAAIATGRREGAGEVRAVLGGLADARVPVVLADDLHHAAEAAIAPLAALLEAGRLRLIGTCEPEAAPRLEAVLPGVEVTAIAPLGLEHVAILVPSMLGRDAVPDELIEAVAELSAGWPAHVAELLTLMVRERVVSRAGAELRVDHERLRATLAWARPLGRDAAIEALRRRLAQLSAAERRILELLALRGRCAPFERLVAAGQLDEGEAVDAVDALLKAQLVCENDPDGDLDLAGEILRSALIDGVAPDRRRDLERRLEALADEST